MHAAPAMKLMMPLLVATAVASCAGSDDGATGPGPDLILGEDEVRAGAVAIKPLRDLDGQQLALSHDQAITHLRAALDSTSRI